MLGEIIEAFYLTVELVGENQARSIGDLQRIACLTGFLIGYTDDREPGALLGLPDAFHGRHFGGLVLKGVQAVKVACQNLQWDHQRGGVNARLQDQLGRGTIHALADSVGTHTRHQERRGQQTREHHVRKAVRERRVEDNRRPALGKELPFANFVACGRMHPGVERQDPKGRQRSAKGHQESGD